MKKRQPTRQRLFRELKYGESSYIRNVSRFFNQRYLPKLGLKTERKTFHSLRHTVIDHLKQKGIEVSLINDLVGHHSGNIDSETEYHNFLAQEVGDVFPSAVKNTGVDVCDMMTEEILVEDLKTLDSHIINVYLVAAVQELKAELDAAKARITELES